MATSNGANDALLPYAAYKELAKDVKEDNVILLKVDDTTFDDNDWNGVIRETRSLAADWFEISIYLGLPHSLLECTQRGSRDCTCLKSWSQVLSHWIKQNYDIDKHGKPSWRTLLRAIARVNQLKFKNLAAAHQLDQSKKQKLLQNGTIHSEVSIKCCHKFPYLKLENTSKMEEEEFHQRLYEESELMMTKFDDLFTETTNSLSKNVTVKDLLKQVNCLGPIHSVYEGSELPVLGRQLPELRKMNSVEDVMSAINDYCSFFNFPILEKIIKNLGTDTDKINLEDYEERFIVYAQHHVFECPSDIGEMSMKETGHANSLVILDVMHESYKIVHLRSFLSKLQKILNVPLRLCRIGPPGSLHMILQIPLSLYAVIFPLTSEQEKALGDLNVIQLSCGNYHFMKQEIKDLAANEEVSDNHSAAREGSSNSVASNISNVIELASMSLEAGPGVLPIDCEKPYDARSLADSGLGSSTASSVSGSSKSSEGDIICDKEFTKIGIGRSYDTAEVGRRNENVLHIASFRGDLKEVKRLVEQKNMNPYERVRKTGMNALHYATDHQNIHIIKYFVEKGYNPACEDSEGLSCLHYATRYGNLELVEYFVIAQKIDPMIETKLGSTPLHSACVCGNPRIVEYLIDKAHDYQYYEPIEELLKYKGQLGWTPLHFAAFHGNLDIVQMLITNFNADPLITDNSDRIALHAAAQEGFLDIVKFLVEHNCNPSNADKSNMTPLHFAAWKGHLNIVKYLTQEQHCDPSCRSLDEQTPLHGAAWNGHLEVVKYLTLGMRCDPLCKTKRNLTPFHWAARKGKLDVVKFYIECLNISPDIKGGQHNRTAIAMARDTKWSKKHEAVVKYLKSAKHHHFKK